MRAAGVLVLAALPSGISVAEGKGHRLSLSGEAELYHFRSKVQRVVKGHNRDRGTITKGHRDTNSGCRACRRTGDDISRRGREGRKKNHDTHEA